MRPILAALALALTAAPARADAVDDAIRNVLGGDPSAYRAVIEGFQAAVRANDPARAAGFVIFPIETRVGGATRTLANPDEFTTAYPQVVTPPIAAAIDAQGWDTLFVRDQGVMLGDGEVWVSGVCLDETCAKQDVGVTTIQSTDQTTSQSNGQPTGEGANAASADPAAPAPDFGALETYCDWTLGCDDRDGSENLNKAVEWKVRARSA